MQVRATNIVSEAQIKGHEVPNPFPVQELSGEARNPLPEEMKTVLDFEHLIKCVECMILNWDVPREPESYGAHEKLVLSKYSEWVRGGK